jgi:ADP-ribosylglycohydrolase
MTETLRLTDSIDRARGPMVAAAIGDALGWPIENRSGRVGGVAKVQPRLELVDWLRREGGGYAPHEVEIQAGSYSDDTQLTLAVGRSRLRGQAWWQHWTDCELPLWLVYERGGGGASKRAAQAWNRGQAPWSEEAKPKDRDRYFNAGGNGVAMRIMPHVLVGATDRFDQIAVDILADGVCTHGHPRALIGALAHGYALWIALQQEQPLAFGELVERTLEEEKQWGEMPAPPPELESWTSQLDLTQSRFSESWEQTRHEMRDLLVLSRRSLDQGPLADDRKTLEEIGAFDKRTNGAGTVTAAAAAFLASRYASQPGQGLTAAAFAKGADTDTIAAMTGSLLGAIDRGGWLSGLGSRLQDVGYIEALSAKLSQGAIKPRPPVPPWRQADRKKLLDSLSTGSEGMTVEMPVFGTCEVVHGLELPTRSSNTINEWVLVTDEGPTLFVTRISPAKAGRREATPTPARPPRPPFWLVLLVADPARSGRFYADSFGFSVTGNGKASRLYVSDRIVLEKSPAPSGPRQSPTLADEGALLAHSEAITLFRDERELVRTHQRLLATEAPVSEIIDRDGRKAFRCADPDGHVIELRTGAELSPPRREPER